MKRTRRLKSTHSDSWRPPEGRSAAGSSSAPFSAEVVSAAVTAHLLTLTVPGERVSRRYSRTHGRTLDDEANRPTRGYHGEVRESATKGSSWSARATLRASASVPLPVLLLPSSSRDETERALFPR